MNKQYEEIRELLQSGQIKLPPDRSLIGELMSKQSNPLQGIPIKNKEEALRRIIFNDDGTIKSRGWQSLGRKLNQRIGERLNRESAARYCLRQDHLTLKSYWQLGGTEALLLKYWFRSLVQRSDIFDSDRIVSCLKGVVEHVTLQLATKENEQFLWRLNWSLYEHSILVGTNHLKLIKKAAKRLKNRGYIPKTVLMKTYDIFCNCDEDLYIQLMNEMHQNELFVLAKPEDLGVMGFRYNLRSRPIYSDENAELGFTFDQVVGMAIRPGAFIKIKWFKNRRQLIKYYFNKLLNRKV